MNTTTVLRWCDERDRVPELVEFFLAHTDTSYISHGEIMDGRAADRERWSEDLPTVLAAELTECEFSATPSGLNGKRVALAEVDGTLAGLALVELAGTGPTRHAVLHDLVVASARRGAGTGLRLLQWLERSLEREGTRYAFLESGIDNTRAHRFFERAGYEPSSITLMKRLRG